MQEDRRPPDDKYARQSFSFRRMKGWQLAGLALVLVLILIVALLYAL